MDWHSPGSPRSGLAVSAGGGLATRAAWTIARQVESGKVLERLTDGRGEDGLDGPSVIRHRELRREPRGYCETPSAERRHEQLPGLDDLVEGEQVAFEGGDLELRPAGPRPYQPRPLGVCRRAVGSRGTSESAAFRCRTTRARRQDFTWRPACCSTWSGARSDSLLPSTRLLMPSSTERALIVHSWVVRAIMMMIP